MKRFVFGLLVSMLIIGVNGCSDKESTDEIKNSVKKYTKSPVKITLEDYLFANRMYHKIYITAVENNLEIKDVSVNKGHCKLLSGSTPKKLDYSQRMSVLLSPRCNIISVNVTTNQGDWSVEY